MKILGIDTSTKTLALGVFDGINNAKAYEFNLELGRKHSSLLIVEIKRVLDALAIKPSDIDYFACGLGPGSFTGLRIGLATIKGFAFTFNKPVLGISSLDILAMNAIDRRGDIAVILDAKRGLVYSCVYNNKKEELKRNSPYMLLPPEDCFKKIKAGSIILGEAINLYQEKILSLVKGAIILDKDYWHPNGGNIIRLSLRQIKLGKTSSVFRVKPMYLYPKECQIK